MRALLELLLARILARATPVTPADARLLVETAGAGWKLLCQKGVTCRFGGDGGGLCVPGRWKDKDWASHDRTCGHCPVYREALSKRRERT